MREKHLGDSFDIVKRFWADRLAAIAPLFAHPKFVPVGIRSQYEKITAIRVLQPDESPSHPLGLFLDPHTGVPLPTASRQKASASHVPVAFIAAEFDRLHPVYMICFDQSDNRNCGLSKEDQRQAKRVALRERGIGSFYYVSHAPFLFMARDAGVLESVRWRLIDSGVPESRLEREGEGDGL